MQASLSYFFVPMAVFAVAISTSLSSLSAATITFNFSGLVQDSSMGELFPGLSVGEAYTGTFSVDPDATVVRDFGTAADYDGSFFGLTIEGNSYSVLDFNVWSTGFDGVEFDFVVPTASGNSIGFLSLRSTADLYSSPDVPTSYDFANFDQLARVSVRDFDNAPFEDVSDRGSVIGIAAIPEPSGALLSLVGIVAIGFRRRRS